MHQKEDKYFKMCQIQDPIVIQFLRFPFGTICLVLDLEF